MLVRILFTLTLGTLSGFAISASALDIAPSSASSIVQQDLNIRVAPLSCAIQKEELDSLTCYIPISQMNLPKGGHLVMATTSKTTDRVTVKAWPRDLNYVQVELQRPSGSEIDLKSVWQSGQLKGTVIYHGTKLKQI